VSACYADTVRLAVDLFRRWRISLAGGLNQPLQDILDYAQGENCVLREQTGSKRLRQTDD